jgi:ferredoxin
MNEPLDIRIDRDRCMGSGNCLFWAPRTFDLDDDGRSVVVDAAATDEDRLRRGGTRIELEGQRP